VASELQQGVDGGSADHVGRQYFAALHSRDDALAWIVDAVWWGDDLDDETHWRLGLTALDEASTDAELWQLGDGPIEEGLAGRPGMMERLRAERRRNPKLVELWRVMRDYHDRRGHPAGVWADDAN
jgi:hypothetical protein